MTIGWWLLLLALVLCLTPSLGEWERRCRASSAANRRDSADWAAERLEPEDFRIEPGHGVGRVMLLRDVTIDSVPCRAGGEVAFGTRGRLQRATLATDIDLDGLPLKGGTLVSFEPLSGRLAGGTLAEPTEIDGVPCAAGGVTLWPGWRTRLVHATLARDAVVCGVPCRGGSEVKLGHGTLPQRLSRATPSVTLTRWGMACAADREIDFFERSGTLAETTDYLGVSLPEGSRFGIDIDFDFLWVELAAATSAFGFELPAGSMVQFVVRDPAKMSPLGRWLAGLFARRSAESTVLTSWRAFSWELSGVSVAAYTRVRVDRRGVASLRIEEDQVLQQVRYPRGSELSIDASGRVVGWRAECPARREGRGGPYRTPVAARG